MVLLAEKRIENGIDINCFTQPLYLRLCGGIKVSRSTITIGGLRGLSPTVIRVCRVNPSTHWTEISTSTRIIDIVDVAWGCRHRFVGGKVTPLKHGTDFEGCWEKRKKSRHGRNGGMPTNCPVRVASHRTRILSQNPEHLQHRRASGLIYASRPSFTRR